MAACEQRIAYYVTDESGKSPRDLVDELTIVTQGIVTGTDTADGSYKINVKCEAILFEGALLRKCAVDGLEREGLKTGDCSLCVKRNPPVANQVQASL